MTQIWLIRLLWMATVVHCEIFCTNVTIQWLQGKWKNCCKFFAEILRKFALHFFVSSKSPHEKCDLLNVYIDINVSDWSISLTIIEKTVLPILKQVTFDKYILLLMNSQCSEIFACYIHGYFLIFQINWQHWCKSNCRAKMAL